MIEMKMYLLRLVFKIPSAIPQHDKQWKVKNLIFLWGMWKIQLSPLTWCILPKKELKKAAQGNESQVTGNCPKCFIDCSSPTKTSGYKKLRSQYVRKSISQCKYLLSIQHYYSHGTLTIPCISQHDKQCKVKNLIFLCWIWNIQLSPLTRCLLPAM